MEILLFLIAFTVHNIEEAFSCLSGPRQADVDALWSLRSSILLCFMPDLFTFRRRGKNLQVVASKHRQ